MCAHAGVVRPDNSRRLTYITQQTVETNRSTRTAGVFRGVLADTTEQEYCRQLPVFRPVHWFTYYCSGCAPPSPSAAKGKISALSIVNIGLLLLPSAVAHAAQILMKNPSPSMPLFVHLYPVISHSSLINKCFRNLSIVACLFHPGSSFFKLFWKLTIFNVVL